MDIDHGVSHIMRSKNKAKKKRDSVKVVYISSPMKVKTSASRFRALVQQLTGPDSDISQLMETNGGKDFEFIHEFDTLPNPIKRRDVTSNHLVENSLRESPTSSDSLSEHFHFHHDVFSSQMDEQIMIPISDLFCDSSELDVLGSYDDL